MVYGGFYLYTLGGEQYSSNGRRTVKLHPFAAGMNYTYNSSARESIAATQIIHEIAFRCTHVIDVRMIQPFAEHQPPVRSIHIVINGWLASNIRRNILFLRRQKIPSPFLFSLSVATILKIAFHLTFRVVSAHLTPQETSENDR